MPRGRNIYEIKLNNGEVYEGSLNELSKLTGINEISLRKFDDIKPTAPTKKKVKSLTFLRVEQMIYTSHKKKHLYNLVDVSRKKFIFEGTMDQIDCYLAFKLDIDLENVRHAYNKHSLIKRRYQIIRSDKKELL